MSVRYTQYAPIVGVAIGVALVTGYFLHIKFANYTIDWNKVRSRILGRSDVYDDDMTNYTVCSNEPPIVEEPVDDKVHSLAALTMLIKPNHAKND